jgi:zinc protease
MKKLKSLIVALSVTAFVASALVITGCSTSKVQSKSSGNQLVMDSSIKQGKLDNGMSYFIRENGEPKNRIQLRLVVKAGSCMEEDDQKGLAHFIEHLCFNGTEHFEKSAIVDYFESIGMAFGPEVNAYTSFENTVYMLELPADNPEILKKSLLVLHDWASAVTFDPEEIEKERGVIVEEWRMRNQGVQGRVSDKETALLLKDSRYAERLPIGDMDIIKSIPRDRIIDFYKKWYRPENMAVVAVGDVKSATLEAAIKEVMGSIEASDKKTKVPSFNVPLQNKKTIEIMKDKELTVVEAYVFQQNPDTEPVTTAEQIRKNYALALASDIFNQRCAEKTNQPDAVWLGAGIGKFGTTNYNSVYLSKISYRLMNNTQKKFNMTHTEKKSWKDTKLYKGNSLSSFRDNRNDAYKMSEIKKILEEKNEIIRRQKNKIEMLENNIIAISKEKAKISNSSILNNGISSF